MVKELANQTWETLATPARRLKSDKKITFDENLIAEVTDRTEEGRVIVKFDWNENFNEILERVGRMPLPPYIKRGVAFRKPTKAVLKQFSPNSAEPSPRTH